MMSAAQQPLSFRNPKVQHLRRLLGRRKSRAEAGQFAFEGPHLVEEALAAGFPMDAVFIDEAASERLAPLRAEIEPHADVYLLARDVMNRVADTSTPQGVVAVAALPAPTVGSVLANSPHGLVFVLVAINDPGNAGTIVRTAEAVGAVAVVFAGACTDPFGPKAVRASAGSAFRIPMPVVAAATDALGELADAGFDRVATVAAGGDDHRRTDLTADVALVLGSEAHGLDPELPLALDRRITIPMDGGVESLNVATAAAVLGYERLRQLDATAGDS